jgi:hypothetical protein
MQAEKGGGVWMIRKGLLFFLMAFMGITVLATPALAAGDYYSYFKSVELIVGEKQATVNGKPATLDQAAFITQGRTLVPLRFISESLGAKVSWDGIERQAIIELADSTVVVTAGAKTAYVDGEIETLDVPAIITGGRTFVPLRFISESLGAHVEYGAELKAVYVHYSDKTDWDFYTNEKADILLFQPKDWKFTTEQDGMTVVVTSPKGSIMKIYRSDQKPSALYEPFKDAAKTIGKTLENEFVYTPGNLDDGFKLDFTSVDAKTKATVWSFLFVEPSLTMENTLVYDLSVNEECLDSDAYVMLDITGLKW